MRCGETGISVDEYHYIVKKEDVIEEGRITIGQSDRIYPYLVYKSALGEIYVNADFYQNQSDEYICSNGYTRMLSKDMEDYKGVTKKHLESKVYGAWMDGAR